MSEKLRFPPRARLFPGIVLAGACVLPFIRADRAEGDVNLVSARIRVVRRSGNSRASFDIELANGGRYHDYYPSGGYRSSRCDNERGGRYYAPRRAAKRYWSEKRIPKYRHHRRKHHPRVYKRVETYIRKEYGSSRGGACPHDTGRRRPPSRKRVYYGRRR